MSSIEEAIEQLEESAAKERKLAVEESKAIKEAVVKASKEAERKVKAEYAELKKEAKAQSREAKKAIRDAKARIEKALHSDAGSTSTRAPRGSRSKDLLTYFENNPGSTVAQAAKSMGVGPTGLYPVAKKLVEEGKLNKDGKRYSVA